MIAAMLSPMPPVRESSCTISTRLQWRVTARIASLSSGDEAAQVEHGGLDAFRGKLLGDAHAVMHVGAVGNHRDVAACPP